MVKIIEFYFFNKRIKNWPVLVVALLAFVLIIPLLLSFDLKMIFMRSYQSGSHVGDTVHFGNYYLTQLRVIPTYLRLLFFPIGQTLDYDFVVSKSLFNPITTFAGPCLLLGLCVTAFKIRKQEPLIAFGIFWRTVCTQPDRIWKKFTR